jgi:CrcB protein
MSRAAPYVAAGGIVGALARWGVFELLDRPTLALLIVNTVGSAMLGSVIVRWPRADQPERLALGVGLCGGLTTFSSFALDIAGRLDHTDAGGAFAVTLGSFGLAIPAFVVARRLADRRGVTT